MAFGIAFGWLISAIVAHSSWLPVPMHKWDVVDVDVGLYVVSGSDDVGVEIVGWIMVKDAFPHVCPTEDAPPP